MPQQFQSLAHMIRFRFADTPEKDAFYSPTDSGWRTWSWKEVEGHVLNIARGLRALGVNDEDRAGILCSTRVEWILCDLGILPRLPTIEKRTATLQPCSLLHELPPKLNEQQGVATSLANGGTLFVCHYLARQSHRGGERGRA